MPPLPLVAVWLCLSSLLESARWVSGQAIDVQTTALTGFCLTPEQGRVRVDKSQPLYNKTIKINMAFQQNYIVVWQLAMQLLLEEVYGYNTALYTDPSNFVDNNVYAAIAEGLVDVDFMHIVGAVAAVEGGWYNDYVKQQHVVTDMGTHDNSLQSGLYFSTPAQIAHPELMLSFYQQYLTARGPTARQAINVFRDASWTLLNLTGSNVLLTNASDPTSVVCRPDSEYTAMGMPPQGCGTVPGYAGLYLPPQCQADPQNDCMVVFSIDPSIGDAGLLQSAIHTLGLNFTVAFVPIPTLVKLYRNPLQLPFMGFSVNLAPGLQHVLYNFSGDVEPLVTRMLLPTYNKACLLGFNHSAYEHYACDYRIIPLGKFARPSLAVDAPRVYKLAGNMQVTSADTDYMARQITLTASPTDYYTIACGWLKNNVDLWISWVSPPANCSSVDYDYSVSDCSSDGTRTLTYRWLQPKACQYGVSLPPPQTISCAFPAAGSGSFATWTSLYAVLSAAVVGLMAHSWWSYRNKSSKGADTAIKPRRLLLRQTSSVSCLLLLGVLLANVGSLTVSKCWLKHALFWCGISLCQVHFIVEADTLYKKILRKLTTSLTKSLKALCLLPVLLSIILFLATAVGDSATSTILRTTPVVVFGGGIIDQPYCNLMERANFIVYILLPCNVLLGLRGWASLTQSGIKLSAEISTFQEAAKNPKRAKSVTQQLKKTYRHRVSLVKQSIALAAVHLLLTNYVAMTMKIASDNMLWTSALNVIIVCVVLVAKSLHRLKPEALYAAISRVVCARKQADQQVTALDKADGYTIAIDTEPSKTHSTQRSGLSEYLGTQAVMDGEFESLAGTLGDPVARHFYKEYMTTAADSESILFLEAVTHLSSSCKSMLATSALTFTFNNAEVAALVDQAEQVVQEFIVAGSTNQVNLAGSLVQRVTSELADIRMLHSSSAGRLKRYVTAAPEQSAVLHSQKAVVTRLSTLFAASIKEVCNLMAVNSWARYLKSKAAAEAEDLIQWSMTFDTLPNGQQKSVLERLQKHYQHQQSDKSMSTTQQQHDVLSHLLGQHASARQHVAAGVESGTRKTNSGWMSDPVAG